MPEEEKHFHLGWRHLLSVACLFCLAKPVFALEGVGALADRLGGAQTYTLTGRTAPWAEVVVVDPEDTNQTDRIYATAELEPSGTFKFTFKVNSAIYSRLQIFAADKAGTTNRILLPSDSSQEFLLPPTIINDPDDFSSVEVALTGYTHPLAAINLTLTNLDTNNITAANANATASGKWSYRSSGLASGKYKAVATSTFNTLKSQNSQEIFFEIPALALPPVVTQITQRIVEQIPGAAQIQQFIQEQGGIISRLAVPVAIVTSGFLLTDLFALLLRLIFGLLHLLGFRRNRRSWGVVYDSRTKRPLERCIVRLYEQNTMRLVETDVTGNDGIFSFLPQAGQYTVKVFRAGYTFPSSLVRGRGSDGEYENIYHGEVLAVAGDRAVAISIPLDPATAKGAVMFKVQQFLRNFGSQLNWGVLIVGLLFSLVTLAQRLSLLNLLVFLIYLLLLVWSLIVWRRRVTGFGVVRDKVSNQPVAGIGVSLYDLEFNRLVQRRVSDDLGRFQLVVPPGNYRLDIVSTDWVLDVSGPKGFRGELLIVKGKKTSVLTPLIYVVRRVR
jgi:hypothetical protein